MTDLLVFLRARFDEEEHAALACGQSAAERAMIRANASVWEASEDAVHAGSQLVAARVAGEDAEHIARWDPARVLAEVEAKRRILYLYEAAEDVSMHADAWTIMKNTVRLMALPYAGHVDYREEAWRP